MVSFYEFKQIHILKGKYMDMNSKTERLLVILNAIKLNAKKYSNYRERELYNIYDMESFELNIGGLQIFIHMINELGIKKGNEFDCLTELFDYFHTHHLNSKITFVIDHYIDNDEFIFHGYHIDDPSVKTDDLNFILKELSIKNNKYGELLNLDADAHPFMGFSLFSQSHFRKALFVLR